MLTAVSGAWADESGSCGTGVTYSYVSSTQTLTISGSGAMADHSLENPLPWSSYKGNITSVVIGSGVTKIGMGAFNNCANLTTVTFDGTPSSMSIGDIAFNGCTKLESITLPAGVTSIGMSAFSDCTNLTAINIPASVTDIDNNAFNGCTNLASISFAATTPLTSDGIGSTVFQECTNLETLKISGSGAMTDYNLNNQPWKDLKSQITTVTIESGVTSIGDYAFDNCANLASVTIPATVTSIGDYAFFRCTNLASITIPAGVESIGTAAFNGCINLTAFNVAEENANYASEDGVLFNKTKTTIVSYPAGKTATTYEIPTTVTSIGNGAFAGCSNLTSVNIPANVTSIGEAAFMSCINLTSVNIPANVTAIGEHAFDGCTNLASVTVYAPACTLGSNTFDHCASALKIYVFNEKVDYYKNAANWDYYKSLITGLNGGYCGATGHVQDVMWLLTGTSPNYTLTIWGTGAMADYSGENYNTQPWKNYLTDITTVVIDEGVTKIGNFAFQSCIKLESISIPASVTSIGNNAFEFCSNLASVNIPASVTTIGDYAFFRCASLTAFNVDDGNANYSSDAIGVLFNKAKTTLIQYPAGNTATSYTIPASVTSIGERAFLDCTNLESITIPATVTSIGENAFEDCTSLTAINVDDGNANYASEDGVLFNKDKTTLVLYPLGKTAPSFTVPASVTSIGENAFYYCTNLTTVTFDNQSQLTTIGNSAFFGCTNLTTVTFNNQSQLTTIGNGAFFGCTNLASVTLPASVTSIGDDAFFYCTNLASVTVYATTPPSLRPRAFFQNASGRKIYVPSISVDTYKAADNWSAYADAIEAIPAVYHGNCGTTGHEPDVTWEIIGTSPNYTLIISGTGEMKGYDPGEQPWKTYNGGITTVVIGNGVTNIGKNICYGYPTLTYVSIPASVTSIGEQAFKGCEKLTSVSIPDDVTSIGKKAFNGCISLSSINIPAGIETFDRSWFDGCSSLTAINVAVGNAYYASEDGVLFNKTKTTLIQYPAGKEATTYEIPTTVTSIGNEAFSWSTKLTSVIIPTGVTTIGDYAFSMSEKLASVTFAAGSSLTSISDYAFFYCENLTSITIPAGVTSIGKDAFYGCSKLTSVSIPAGVTSIGEAAFYYCTNLASINIPAGVTSIGADLFSGCSKLASVTIPASVTTIGDGAFRNCALTSIEIPASVTSIGMGAFLQCGNLGAITMNSSPLIGYDAFEYIKEVAVVAINAPAHDADSYQWATFYNQNYAFQADDNTQVFKVTLDGTTVTLLEVTDKIVNAGTPVVLKSTGTPVMTLTTTSSSDTQENNLVGTSATITNPGNAYVLNNGDNGVGFYKLASTGTIEFGKSYLVATAGAREFLTFGETTSLTPIPSPIGEGGDVIYDIHGRRVNGKPSKGLYIINGKKVIMK